MKHVSGHSMKFNIQVVVRADEGGFHAFCPALKGLHVDGDTEGEALQNARDAAGAYIASLLKHDDPIPVGLVMADEGYESTELAANYSKAHRHLETLQVPSALAYA